MIVLVSEVNHYDRVIACLIWLQLLYGLIKIVCTKLVID